MDAVASGRQRQQIEVVTQKRKAVVIPYQRCTTIAFGMKNCTAGRRRGLDETRAYVAHERWRGMASSNEIMERASLADAKTVSGRRK